MGFFNMIVPLSTYVLCGHNAKEFDIPYVCRRAMVHGLSLPSQLMMRDKKPREIVHKDTMEMRKFGDYKSYTSLALLCEILDIPTPKDDIDGSQVSSVYWDDHNIDRIVHYCKKDVVATAKVYQKLTGMAVTDWHIIER
jgi:DNA polymerase elongation subunit (family B)